MRLGINYSTVPIAFPCAVAPSTKRSYAVGIATIEAHGIDHCHHCERWAYNKTVAM